MDPKEVYNNLNNCILLCYEEGTNFCHRYIVAYWLEITLGIKVDEVMMNKTGELTILDKPRYIKDMLLEIMNNSDYKISI